MSDYFERLKKLGAKVIYSLFYLLGCSISLYGIIILVVQIVHFLKYSLWIKIGLITLFEPYTTFSRDMFEDPLSVVPTLFHGKWTWLLYPTSWFGLHKIIHFIFTFIPLSLTMFLFGIIIISATHSEYLEAKKTSIFKEKTIKTKKDDC